MSRDTDGADRKGRHIETKGQPAAAGAPRADLRAVARQRFARAWERFMDHVKARHRPHEAEPGRYRAAVHHTRPLVLAEAIGFLVFMFTIDDLQVLRFPAFLLGAMGAALILAVGGLLHGRSLHRHTRHMERPVAEVAWGRYRTGGRVLFIAVVAGTAYWFMLFSSGVTPWSA